MHPGSETQVQAYPGPSLRSAQRAAHSCGDISPTCPRPCASGHAFSLLSASPPQAEKLCELYHRSALRDVGTVAGQIAWHLGPIPGPVQKLLVLPLLRGDKVTNAMQDFVAANLEPRFIEPQASAVSQCLELIAPWDQGPGCTCMDPLAALVRPGSWPPHEGSERFQVPSGSPLGTLWEPQGAPSLALVACP